jgi:hypothetical protein
MTCIVVQMACVSVQSGAEGGSGIIAFQCQHLSLVMHTEAVREINNVWPIFLVNNSCSSCAVPQKHVQCSREFRCSPVLPDSRHQDAHPVMLKPESPGTKLGNPLLAAVALQQIELLL